MPQDDITWAVPVRLDGIGVKVFTYQLARKSSQWVALVRDHAKLVARERELLWEGTFMYPTGKEYIKRRRCGRGGAIYGYDRGEDLDENIR